MQRLQVINIEAKGQEGYQSWTKTIPPETSICIGRAPRNGFSVPWDKRISREHATIRLSPNGLFVEKLGTALNAIYFNDDPCDSFEVQADDSFVIGSTTFTVRGNEQDEEEDVLEYTYQRSDLDDTSVGNAEQRLGLISRLPVLLDKAVDQEEFAKSVTDLVLHALSSAAAAAIVRMPPDKDAREVEPLLCVCSTRQHDVIPFRPSRRLIARCLQRGQVVMHYWGQSGDGDADGAQSATNFTMMGASWKWAFAVPYAGEQNAGWCLYVAGAALVGGNEEDIKADIKFAEIIVQFLSAIQAQRQLDHERSMLAQFFSPSVLETLSGQDAKQLAASEKTITTMFCDLRGFSRLTEEGTDLHVVLERVSTALSTMTTAIMQHEGAVADFQGDAALAFWGWPTEHELGPIPAARAAMAIFQEFRQASKKPEHLLHDVDIGIGIGFGNAIAGKIGTKEQAKVGVLGPVVNQSSRLEGLTKFFGVPILLDETSAGFIQALAKPSEMRVRGLVPVRLYGMQKITMVSELLPGAEYQEGRFADAYLPKFEQACSDFIRGDWAYPLKAFTSYAKHDPASAALLSFMQGHGNQPPGGWTGVIEMDHK